MEYLIFTVVLFFMSLTAYCVKRGFDIAQHLLGMPDKYARPTLEAVDNESPSIIDEYVPGSESVIAEHVLARQAQYDAKADQLRKELEEYRQNPLAGMNNVYDLPHTSLPKEEEYAR